MKRMAVIVLVTVIVFAGLSMAYANEEENIEKLVNTLETAINSKDIAALQQIFYRNYYEIIAIKGNRLICNTSEGGKLFKEYEKTFRAIKAYKNNNRKITVYPNMAYVHCEESQTLTNGRTEVFQSVLTCVKDRGRWYIAVCSAHQVQ